MLKRAVIALVLLAMPTIAFAQDGQRGTRGQRGRMGPRNPLAIVIDRKEELKLSDEQLEKIQDVDKKLTEKNEPLLAKMREMREGEGQPDREAMMKIMQEIRANNMSAHAALKDILTPEQFEMANRIIAEATPRGRRGGRGGGGN